MRQATAFRQYFLQLLRLFRQGTVSFVLFESLCSLYLVHCVPWSLCFFGPLVCCEEVLLCIVQQWTVFTVFLRCSAWPVQLFSSVWSVHCFSSVCFFPVLCFGVMFLCTVFSLVSSVLSMFLHSTCCRWLAQLYPIACWKWYTTYSILYVFFPMAILFALYMCVYVFVWLCVRGGRNKKFSRFLRIFCGTFVVHVGGK